VTIGDPARSGLKKDWTPTTEAFHRFLAWLDEGVESRFNLGLTPQEKSDLIAFLRAL
jgi:hypothetical protein